MGKDGRAAMRGYGAFERAGDDLVPADAARLTGASADDSTASRPEELTSGEAVPNALAKGHVAPDSQFTLMRRLD